MTPLSYHSCKAVGLLYIVIRNPERSDSSKYPKSEKSTS